MNGQLASKARPATWAGAIWNVIFDRVEDKWAKGGAIHIRARPVVTHLTLLHDKTTLVTKDLAAGASFGMNTLRAAAGLATGGRHARVL